MRYIATISLLLLFGCKATGTAGKTNPRGSFVVLIEYNETEAETHVLDILNKNTALLQYEEGHTYFFSNEIMATCINFNDVAIDDLRQQLKQSPGVCNVVINPLH